MRAVKLNVYDVIRKPLVTEKNSMLAEKNNTYIFEIAKNASKKDVKRAVAECFNVNVITVNTMRRIKKSKRRQFSTGFQPTCSKNKKRTYRKIAYVTLAEGESIDFIDENRG